MEARIRQVSEAQVRWRDDHLGRRIARLEARAKVIRAPALFRSQKPSPTIEDQSFPSTVAQQGLDSEEWSAEDPGY